MDINVSDVRLFAAKLGTSLGHLDDEFIMHFIHNLNDHLDYSVHFCGHSYYDATAFKVAMREALL